MRGRLFVILCALFVAACASAPVQAIKAASADSRQTLTIYDGVPPPVATSMGPVRVTVCNGTIRGAKKQLEALVIKRGGTGMSHPICHEEGIGWTCWSTAVCGATAYIVPRPGTNPIRGIRAKRKEPKK